MPLRDVPPEVRETAAKTILRTRIMLRSAWEFLGFRSAWDLLGFLRIITVTAAYMLFLVGFFAVSEKVPWIAWTAVLLVVAAAVRNCRRWRGSTSHGGRERQNVEDSDGPAWLDDARRYYSEIGGASADPVSVFDAADTNDVRCESPATLCLRLEPQSDCLALVRVLDAGGREQGIIRSEGLVPGVRYAMRREGELVWMLSVRSIVRKGHALELANGDSWTFDTPFFWWQNLTGTAFGAPRLLGGLVVPTKRVWAMWIEPGRDTIELLAAVAFMHRQWFHW
jgi:hypothetical protein